MRVCRIEVSSSNSGSESVVELVVVHQATSAVPVEEMRPERKLGKLLIVSPFPGQRLRSEDIIFYIIDLVRWRKRTHVGKKN